MYKCLLFSAWVRIIYKRAIECTIINLEADFFDVGVKFYAFHHGTIKKGMLYK